MDGGGAPRQVDRPAAADGALGSYGRAIKAHWLLVAVIMLAAVAGSVYALSRRSPDYKATAQILITPVNQQDETVLGLSVLRDSGDPARTAQTAATLLESKQAAEAAARRLGPEWPAQAILDAVSVTPQGESNVLAVTAISKDPDDAAALANDFAQASLGVRRTALRREISARIQQLKARRRALAKDDADSSRVLADEIAALESVKGASGDPSLSLAELASTPGSSTAVAPWLLTAVALLAGFGLGTLAALGLELMNRRIRDEDEVTRLYPLSILTRVPPLPRRVRKGAVLSPGSMPPAAREAFRTLRAQLERRAKPSRAVMVTSASAGDGKTTAAAGLAVALADAGYSVVLMDFDWRRPDVARLSGVTARAGLVSLLTSDVELEQLMIGSPHTPGLRILPAVESDGVLLESLMRGLPDILARGRLIADYVVVDTAPVGEVSDALGVIEYVDDILLVVRPGHTDRHAFEQARDLLERSDARPTGIVLTGQMLQGSRSYTYGGERVGRAPSEASTARLARR